jgi:hypothetical protein
MFGLLGYSAAQGKATRIQQDAIISTFTDSYDTLQYHTYYHTCYYNTIQYLIQCQHICERSASMQDRRYVLYGTIPLLKYVKL